MRTNAVFDKKTHSREAVCSSLGRAILLVHICVNTHDENERLKQKVNSKYCSSCVEAENG